MTQILVISDSHGAVGSYQQVLEREAGRFALLVHLGDGASDSYKLCGSVERLIQIKGNMDHDLYELPANTIGIAVFEAGGVRIAAVHGDRHGVKNHLAGLVQEAKLQKADLILYGHTHAPAVEEINGVICFNPGALKNGEYGIIICGAGIVQSMRHLHL